MSQMIEKPETHGALNVPARISWKTAEPPLMLGYSFDAILVKEEGAGYVVSVAQLPGVVSEGDNPESAIRNIVEAFRAAIETYAAEDMSVPWREPRPTQSNEIRVRVAVNV